jgi:CheY-like chemotaxis protein
MLVLIVEDEAAIARFLERGLNAHGHRVLCAYDGEEGSRLAVEEPVDLVLLDISLPRLDGREVLRRIRLRRSDLPILMLTALDDTRNKVGALDVGADDYLTKPFVFEELLARIRADASRGPARLGADTDRRPENRPPLAPRLAKRREDRALEQGVRASRVFDAPLRAGPLQAADPLRHLGLRLRTRLRRRRRLRPPPPKLSGSPRRSLLDPNHPRRRLSLRSSPQRLKRFASRVVSQSAASILSLVERC